MTDVPQVPDQLQWRVSSYSQGENDCVEVTCDDDSVWVRDTKNRDVVQHFTAAQWNVFMDAVKHRGH